MEARLNKNSLMWGAFFQDMEFNILSMTPGGWDKLLLECLLKAWKKKKTNNNPQWPYSMKWKCLVMANSAKRKKVDSGEGEDEYYL